jgi:hypothetical protein
MSKEDAIAVEASSGRKRSESPLPKSRAQSRDLESYKILGSA